MRTTPSHSPVSLAGRPRIRAVAGGDVQSPRAGGSDFQGEKVQATSPEGPRCRAPAASAACGARGVCPAGGVLVAKGRDHGRWPGPLPQLHLRPIQRQQRRFKDGFAVFVKAEARTEAKRREEERGPVEMGGRCRGSPSSHLGAWGAGQGVAPSLATAPRAAPDGRQGLRRFSGGGVGVGPRPSGDLGCCHPVPTRR